MPEQNDDEESEEGGMKVCVPSLSWQNIPLPFLCGGQK
jgi:hypothetical protein